MFKSGIPDEIGISKKVGRHTVIGLPQGARLFYIEPVPDQLKWQKGAACKGVPSYLFFPEEMKEEGFEENPLFRGKKAADYCDNCPVKAICREFSVLHDAEGIWGNTTTGQRDRRYSRYERFEMRDTQEELGNYEPLYGHS
ncbi:WhiB family transcriptional regulator [Streptomyces sp. NPDC048720]|uniref:WhiB family transcriptional regulator n=1 Tax=Streptomyces sp. NPDC048720 TaxID=3365588 RepID=UPI003710952E